MTLNRNVLLLALCQAMLMTSISLSFTTAPLIGARLAANPGLATMPLAVMMLTTMLMLFPLSGLMQRHGRRPVFIGGALIGMIGIGGCAVGIYTGSFVIFLAGCVLLGIFNGSGQFYRFAAVESVSVEQQGNAISMTLAGGIIAAFFGPNLARLTRDLIAPSFTACFVALLGVALLSIFFSWHLRLPELPPATKGEARPLSEMARQPTFIVAIMAALLGWPGMSLVMTATPLAMSLCGLGFSETATVLQWHPVAMFTPSLFSGHLIRRLGAVRVIGAGCLCFLACVGINLRGNSIGHFEFGLIMLGIGWNFLYVGATSLLTQTYRPAERGRVQAFNDTIVFSASSCTALASAAVVSRFGWETVNIALLPAVALMLLALGWLTLQQRTAKAAA